MNSLSQIQQIAVIILPLVFAITLHEVAHGWVANYFGDSTAKMMGRLTLNPIKHIDLVGSIIVPISLFLTTGFLFGWAKPVPVNWNHLRNPRRDMALVALAGPMSNFLMAVLWTLVIKLVLIVFGNQPNNIGAYFYFAGLTGLMINLVLMVLNLLPLPPLDGSKVLLSLLSPRVAMRVAEYETYGLILLALLLISGVLSQILFPPIDLLRTLIVRMIL